MMLERVGQGLPLLAASKGPSSATSEATLTRFSEGRLDLGRRGPNDPHQPLALGKVGESHLTQSLTADKGRQALVGPRQG
ncbi:hypothetical protein EUGRSUZ_A00837 [Eucalyptus grandis]|uniref:Uncharacterized protein n=2 Tax=Eucalyptus grandis TaxID=71139 RepID=A0ACC3M0J4_EUCGR|nr:hypothetical protein EUGRSUZ_A00837 [Eucalyptus grandis]